MIWLKRLALERFRAFEDRASIPLDADVVLIFGENAAGKSSFLNAILLALNGSVDELRNFGSDYPRCLLSHGDGSPANVTIETVAGTNSVLVSPESISLSRGIDPDLGSLFARRSYLPQSRLRRLIESYSSEGASGDQAVVEVVRSALGLERLEALRDGLEDAADWRRLRKLAPALGSLEEDIEKLQRHLARLRETKMLAESEATSAEVEAVAFIERDPPIAGLSLPSRLKEIGSAVLAEGNLSALRDELKALRRAEVELVSASSLLSGNLPDLEKMQSKVHLLEAELLQAVASRSQLQEAIAPLLAEVGLAAPPVNGVVSAVRAVLQAETAEVERRSRTLEDARREHVLISQRVSSLDRELAAIASESTSLWATAISAFKYLKSHADGDICPVCDRDFSEVARGPLIERIEERIRELAAAQVVAETAIATRQELLRERERIVRRLEAIGSTVVFETEASLLARKENSLEQLRGFLAPLEQIFRRERDISGELETTREDRDRAGRLKERRDEAEGALLRISRVFSDANSPELNSLEPLLEHIRMRASLIEDAASRIEEFSSRKSNANRLLERLVSTRSIAEERVKEIKVGDATLRTLIATRARAEHYVERVRRVRAASAEAEGAILGQVLTERLGGLWRELFGRLARNETYRPRLSPPSSVRGHLRTDLGVASGTASFRNIASILSEGNLNTAALSLFFSLHLLTPAQVPVLVLDDPLQNMDDVHAIEFAALLRSLSREGRRQVVVAVHERPLFEFLSAELGPSSARGSLLRIELERLGSKAHVREPSRVTHAPDHLEFG